MGISSTFANDLLKLVLQATAIANIADNAASSPLTNLYLSLHTADPGAGGDQTTNECAYTDYARVAIARSGSGWDVTSNVATPDNDIAFPECAGGVETARFIGIGTASSSTGKLLFSGAITPTIAISTGVVPTIDNTTTVTLT